jgi:uncharacterized protein (DUF736 family)
MAKPNKKEFDKRFSGTINSVKGKDLKPTKNLRGQLYFTDVANPVNFVGHIDDSDPKKTNIEFTLTRDDNSDVFATQNVLAESQLRFNRTRQSENAPDWRSSEPFSVDGTKYRMSAWTKESKFGKFLSVSIQTDDAYQERIAKSTGDAPAEATPAPTVTADEAGL